MTREKTKQDVQEVLFYEDYIVCSSKNGKTIHNYHHIESYNFDEILDRGSEYDILLLKIKDVSDLRFIPLLREQVAKVDEILQTKEIPTSSWDVAHVSALKKITSKKATHLSEDEQKGKLLYAWEQPKEFATHKLSVGMAILMWCLGLAFGGSAITTLWGIHMLWNSNNSVGFIRCSESLTISHTR